MFKIAKLGVALVFGLLLAFTLLTPGAFAKSANTSHRSAAQSANQAVATAVFHSASHTAHAAWGGWGWGGGWGGWGGWGWGGWGWGNGWGWGGWGGCGGCW